jgi:signal transduction histidine kinase
MLRIEALRNRKVNVTDAASSQVELIEYFQQFAEREKTAFARDLHDELGGLLIAAVMDLETLRPFVGTLPVPAESRFARAQRALQSAIDLSRRMTEQLRPTLLDNVGLFAAMRWRLRDACEKSAVHCIEELPSVEPRLNSQTGIALYRIAEEAILIGLQREHVTELMLRGECIRQRIILTVSANGDLLPAELSAPSNIALASMRHRARSMGGDVSLQSPEGTGIRLTVTTPQLVA